MKKVSLIYPTLRNWESWPPLSLAQLAAVLERDGHRVEIIDRNVLLNRRKGSMSATDADTRRMLEDFAPDIVGITATTPLVPDAFRCARFAKETAPNATVIMGGAHASLMPERTLRECGEIDMVCRGEGEFVLAELAAGAAPEKVLGLYYREDGGIRSAGEREMTREFDSLPHPARHLIDMKRYLRPTSIVVRGVEARATHIFSGRGCPGKCRFCAGHRVNGPGLRLHSAEYIIEEIRQLADDYGVQAIYFAEEMFLANRRRFEAVCRWLIDSGYGRRVMSCVNSRVDFISEEKLRLMREAGVVQVEFGIESGSQRCLDIMCKGVTVEQNEAALAMTRKAGIRALANMIVGIPGETLEDIRKTRKFLKKTKPDFVAVNKFCPYPGCPMQEDLAAAGHPDQPWESYTATDTTFNYCDVDDGAFIREFLKLRARYYALNTLNAVRFNFGRRPWFIFKSPYYMFKDPLRYAWRRASRRFRRPVVAEAAT